VCLGELGRGIQALIEARRQELRVRRKAGFLEMWKQHKSLWIGWETTNLGKRVMRDLCRKFGPLPEEDLELPVERGVGWDGSQKKEDSEIEIYVHHPHKEAERFTLAQLKNERRILREGRIHATRRERLLAKTEARITRAEAKIARQVEKSRAAWEPSLTQWLIEHAEDLIVDDQP
jgi:hypothetical protein